MNRLFQNVVWPAIAGNVVWAFFSIAIYENWDTEGVKARLLALLMLSIYLCYDWITTNNDEKSLKEYYWVGDIFSAITIAVFAITASKSNLWLYVTCSDWVYWVMISVFGVVVLGHLFGAWEPKAVATDKKWSGRLKLAGINSLGIVFYIGLAAIWPTKELWHLPISIAIVLIFWFPCRPKIYP